MIEQSIYFALGCIVTALCALMFAPIFWTRALRLSQKKLQLQIPLSMQEIYAERDGLRAEFAVDLLRIEQELERVQAGKAHDMAEIGRRSMATARVTEELAALKRSLEETIDDLKRQLADHKGQLTDREARIARLESDLTEAQALAERLREAEQATAAKAAVDRDAAERARATEAQAARDRLDAFTTDLAVARSALFAAEQGRSADRATTTARIGRLEAENTDLQSALTEAKGHANGALDLEGSGLRASLHELGLKVADMARDAKPRSAPVPAKDEVQPVD